MPSFDPFDAFAELVVCVMFHMPRHPHVTSSSGASSDEDGSDAAALVPQNSLRGSFRLDSANCRLYYNSGAGAASSGPDGACGGGLPSECDSLADLYDLCHMASLHHAHTRAAAAAAQVLSRPSSIGSFISVNTVPATGTSTPLSQLAPAPVATSPTSSPSAPTNRAGPRLGWPFAFSRPAACTARSPASRTPPPSPPLAHSGVAGAGASCSYAPAEAPPSPGTTGGSSSFIPITADELAADLMSPGSWVVEAGVPAAEGNSAHRSPHTALPSEQPWWTPTGASLTAPVRGGLHHFHAHAHGSDSVSTATSPSRGARVSEKFAARRATTPTAAATASTGSESGVCGGGDNNNNNNNNNATSSVHTSVKGSTLPSGYTSISEFVEI